MSWLRKCKRCKHDVACVRQLGNVICNVCFNHLKTKSTALHVSKRLRSAS